MIRVIIKTVICSVALLQLTISHACVPPVFERVANEYDVPADIFYAIALTESGRSTQDYGFKVWPWALNIDKASYFPNSKEEAIELIQQAVKSGSHHFDVGVMQVSWRFHRSTFQSKADYALDIGANLRAGAKILSEFLAQSGDVWEGVGFYNAGASKKPASVKAAKRYSDRVKRVYDKYVKERCHETLLAAS